MTTTRTEVKVQIQVKGGKAAVKKKGGPAKSRTQVSTNTSEGGVNVNVVTNVTLDGVSRVPFQLSDHASNKIMND